MVRRTNSIKYWFCKNCNNPFKLLPWNVYKNIPITDLCCPICNSKSIVHSTSLTKAIIEKQSTHELLNIIKTDEQRINIYLEQAD
jgi:hypothetical protein